MEETTVELMIAFLIGMIAALVLFCSGWCFVGWIVEADDQ